MEISYELTEDDLSEVQAQLLVTRREALRRSPRRFALLMAVIGLLCWPLWCLLSRDSALLSEDPPRLVVFLLTLGAVGVTVYALGSHRSAPRLPRLDAWVVRRMTRQAVRQSVLGPITVTLTEEGLVRRNGSGELRVAWNEVHDLLRSPRIVTVRLQRQQRVILVPTRAFSEASGAAAFLERLEALSGRKSVEVGPDAQAASSSREPPRAVRPGWLAALGVAVLLLVVARGLPWYYDPRPGNPPGHVIVYTTDWCPVCKRLRRCLGRHNVPFEERDIEKSSRARREWAALDGTGVPLTLAGQRVASGMYQEELQGALAEAGYHVDCWSSASLEEDLRPR